MTITLVGGANKNTTGGLVNLTLNCASGADWTTLPSPGDLMIVGVNYQDDSGLPQISGPPSGWTQLGISNAIIGTWFQAVYYRVATSVEATYSWVAINNGQTAEAWVLQGVILRNAANPFVADPSLTFKANQATSSSQATAAAVVANASTALLAGWGQDQNAALYSSIAAINGVSPTVLTKTTSAPASENSSFAMGLWLAPGAGTWTPTATYPSPSGEWFAFRVGVEAAAPPPAQVPGMVGSTRTRSLRRARWSEWAPVPGLAEIPATTSSARRAPAGRRRSVGRVAPAPAAQSVPVPTIRPGVRRTLPRRVAGRMAAVPVPVAAPTPSWPPTITARIRRRAGNWLRRGLGFFTTPWAAGPPRPQQNVTFSVAPPFLQWSAENPTLGWMLATPLLQWSTGGVMSTVQWSIGGPMPAILSAISLEYVQVPVLANLGTGPYNPTGDAVQMAFVHPRATPGFSDWLAAVWKTDTTGTLPKYYSCCLVGPGGTITLTPGQYDVWVKITDSPEVPAIFAGQVQIT